MKLLLFLYSWKRKIRLAYYGRNTGYGLKRLTATNYTVHRQSISYPPTLFYVKITVFEAKIYFFFTIKKWLEIWKIHKKSFWNDFERKLGANELKYDVSSGKNEFAKFCRPLLLPLSKIFLNWNQGLIWSLFNTFKKFHFNFWRKIRIY